MAVLSICSLPDPVLRRTAEKVSAIDSSIRKLIDDMIDTMQEARGVGLAAPQVGVSVRVVVLQMPGERPFALVNPEILDRSGEQQVVEGCLSVPGYIGEIKRPASVTVKGWDRRGAPVRIEAEGLLAQALAHEIDHLKGIVYVDYIEEETKLSEIKRDREP